MTADKIPAEVRVLEPRQHIDPGFVNLRLILSTFGEAFRGKYEVQARTGPYPAQLLNDHLVTTMALDACRAGHVLTLSDLLMRLEAGESIEKSLFCSTETIKGMGAGIYEAVRGENPIEPKVPFDRAVVLRYSTEHVHSSTSKTDLADGCEHSLLAAVHAVSADQIEVRPLIMGPPTYDHPANESLGASLSWYGWSMYELIVSDIDQFGRAAEVTCERDEWMAVMQQVPEVHVKDALSALLGEPLRKDWGGEQADHHSASVSVRGRKTTAAFLLKGPAAFREMTPDLLGKRADQIYRLAATPASVLVVQHCHLIGEAVRATLRNFAVTPHAPRHFCLIDGQDTYRILKAYDRLP